MEWGLINALLKTKKYINGARSLTQILGQIKINNTGKIITRSCLPSNDILEMNVHLEDFFRILDENSDFVGNSYIIAPDVHGVWMSSAKTRHHEYIKDFKFLPIFTKESNYEAAKRIPLVLAEAGLIVVHENHPLKFKTKQKYENVLKEIGTGTVTGKTNLELMAEKEHQLWMEFHFENGWTDNKIRNDSNKQHNCLIAYKELSEENKDKDREQVEKYFDFLQTAGFGIAEEKE